MQTSIILLRSIQSNVTPHKVEALPLKHDLCSAAGGGGGVCAPMGVCSPRGLSPPGKEPLGVIFHPLQGSAWTCLDKFAGSGLRGTREMDRRVVEL